MEVYAVQECRGSERGELFWREQMWTCELQALECSRKFSTTLVEKRWGLQNAEYSVVKGWVGRTWIC